MNSRQLTVEKAVVCVGGGIAAYKAVELCSLLQKRGIEIRVAMSSSALKFIQPLTFAAITQHAVYENVFDKPDSYVMEHITWAKWADALVIAPATADLIAKIAHGIADDPITTLYLAFSGEVFVAPAMNTQMWEHPAVVANLDLLTQRGVHVIEPAEGVLACGDIGAGRLEEPKNIVDIICGTESEQESLGGGITASLTPIHDDLIGKTVVITSGPTHEYIDSVRYLSNPSSGKMGAALAIAAASHGATVHLITGPVGPESKPRDAANIHEITSADEMLKVVKSLANETDIFIFAAAVGDYKAENHINGKLKRNGDSLDLRLVENPDISKVISQHKRENQITVGFAAEVVNHTENAYKKIQEKNLNAIVLNDVGNSEIGFRSDQNAVTWIQADQEPHVLEMSSKKDIAERIIERIVRLV